MEDGDDVRLILLQLPSFSHIFSLQRNSSQKTFNHDEVQGVVSESVETVLGTATYSHSKVGACGCAKLLMVFICFCSLTVNSGWVVASYNRRKRKLTNVVCRALNHDRLQVLKKLAHFNRPFKYIGETAPTFLLRFLTNCLILQ